jgi:hypothetical protein
MNNCILLSLCFCFSIASFGVLKPACEEPMEVCGEMARVAGLPDREKNEALAFHCWKGDWQTVELTQVR